MTKISIINHTSAGRGQDYLPGLSLTFYKEVDEQTGRIKVYVCAPDYKPADHYQGNNPCKPTNCKCDGFLTSDGYELEIFNDEPDEGFYTENEDGTKVKVDNSTLPTGVG